MRTKMKKSSAEIGLSRILDGFAQELTVASDPEILSAAKDLGMDLSMKESAAYAGITFPLDARAFPARETLHQPTASTPQEAHHRHHAVAPGRFSALSRNASSILPGCS